MPKSIPAFLFAIFMGCFTCCGDALDNWTKVSSTTFGGYVQIIYGGGFFTAISAQPYTNGMSYPYSNGVSFSRDGTQWTHLKCAGEPAGIAFGNGLFALSSWDTATDGDAGFLFSVTNPANFPAQAMPSNLYNGQYGLAYGNGVFVATGYVYEGTTGEIVTSTDGQNWTYQSPLPAGSTSNVFLSGIAYGNGIFLAVGAYPYFTGETTSRVFSSTDGIHWNRRAVLSSLPPVASLSFVNGVFYAPTIITSGFPPPSYAYATTNGGTWIGVSPPYPSLYTTATFGQGIYVSVHPGYPMATSADGTNWSTRNTGITNALTCIAYGNNCFVACSSDGSIFCSGSTVPSLSPQSRFTNGGFQLTVTDGIGPAYQIQGSTNLVNWTNVAMLTNIEVSNTFLDLAASNFSRHFYRLQAQ